MKKTFAKSRLLSIIATMLLVLCLTACGSQNGGDTKTPEVATPPDLTGEWVQSNSDSKESYQAATISGDTIEIYWVNTDSESKSLYWAGTFVAPETADEPYTWESANDKEKTGSALLAPALIPRRSHMKKVRSATRHRLSAPPKPCASKRRNNHNRPGAVRPGGIESISFLGGDTHADRNL